jgi:hypothetical protein
MWRFTNSTAEFEPFSTAGVPLAVREDWRELLEAVVELASGTVWLAFHGLGEKHDRQLNPPGQACPRARPAGAGVLVRRPG